MEPKLNIGIFAHIDSGKTTLVERILFESGEIVSPGKIEDGTTESDTLSEEISRGISILSSIIQITCPTEKGNLKLNLIDTPGHIDFYSQVEYTIRAVDIAVLLIDATTGVKSQTELITERLLRYGIPFCIFLNKIDLSTVQVEDLLSKISANFEISLCPLFEKDKAGSSFLYNPENISEERILPFFDWDELLCEEYLLKPDSLADCFCRGLKRGFFGFKLIPVLSGSALNGRGVRELLDLLFFLESGVPSYSGVPGAVVLQRKTHPELGKLSFLRAYGELDLENPIYLNLQPLHLQPVYIFNLDGYRVVSKLEDRDIIATPSLRKAIVGDRLKILPENPLTFPPEEEIIRQFSVIIEPISPEFRDKILDSLEELVWEDNGLVYQKLDVGQIILKGCGELHLEVSINRLSELCGDLFSFGKLKVARYELIKNIAKTELLFEHSAYGGRQKSGIIKGFIEKTLDFKVRVHFHVNLSDNIRDSIESGFLEILSHGNFGSNVIGLDLHITSYIEPIEINEQTISLVKISIISGIKSIIKGNTLEIGPINLFDIMVPGEFLGQVIAGLQMRTAKIQEVDSITETISFIKGEAPAEKLVGFASSLRNMTKGKGTISMVTLFNSKQFSYL